MWCDSHCHLPPTGAHELIEAALGGGVARLVAVGTDAETSQAAIETAVMHRGVGAAAGLHPHVANQGIDAVEDLIRSNPTLVAVGECGLDYHYDFSPRPLQRQVFAAQVALANRYGLALVVHTREAWEDTIAILRSEGVPDRTVFHCFTGGPGEARQALDLGAWLSFSGVVTFKGAGDIKEAAALCPLERLLVETDSPYLTPVPHRGKPNTPANVPLVGAGVAAAKGLELAVVEAATWAAAEAVFRLGPFQP